MATWSMAMDSPDRFAAVATVSGIGDVHNVARMKDLPIWVFHGDADPDVPFAADAATVNALRAIGGRVRFTIYPGGGHDAATATYNDTRLYDWFLQQKRAAPAEPSGGTLGPATMPAR
jgi:predicted peptidase